MPINKNTATLIINPKKFMILPHLSILIMQDEPPYVYFMATRTSIAQNIFLRIVQIGRIRYLNHLHLAIHPLRILKVVTQPESGTKIITCCKFYVRIELLSRLID